MTGPALRIQLLGGVSVTRGGEPVRLPRSKKTRALLGYLIASGRAHSREQLCELLWDVTDNPRGALRWSLSKIRGAISEPDAPRVVTDGESVAFQAQGAWVDVLELRALCERDFDGASAADIAQVADGFAAGELLEDAEMPDFAAYQAWCVAQREDLRRLQVRALCELCERLSDDPERVLSYARLRVHYRPADVGHRVDLLDVLAATGRHREAEQHYRQGLAQAAQAGVNDDPLRAAWKRVAAPPARIAPPPAPSEERSAGPELRQDVRFCASADGTRIAYATCGDGPVLLKTANWLSHLEYDWESPLWRHIVEELAREHTFVRYDDRGSGLSDAGPGKISFDDFVADMEAVADAVGNEAFTLLGISKGASVAIEYAVRHPERVRGLILYGGFAAGWVRRASEQGLERSRALSTLIRTGWGSDNPAFRQVFTSLFVPGGNLEQMRWFNELQRISATPEHAALLREATGEIDVRPRLAEVSVPTLVMHVTDDAVVPYRYGKELAMHIPNARLVTLEGDNHLILESDPGWPRFVDETRRFLAEVAEA